MTGKSWTTKWNDVIGYLSTIAGFASAIEYTDAGALKIESANSDIGSPIQSTQDGSSKSIPVPATAVMFAVHAEGGDVRLEIDGAASATSTIRVPEDTWLVYPIVGGTQTLFSYGNIGVVANVRFLG